MKTVLQDYFKEPIFFISPDVKRGMGLEDILPNYHLICAYDEPIIPILRKQGAKIFCLAEHLGKKAYQINNSGKIIDHPMVSQYISNNSQDTPWIMYFKPSIKLDYLIQNKGFKAIGNNAELNELFENKINFSELINKYLPQYSVPFQCDILGNLNYATLAEKLGKKLVIQFGHGWAGKTTFFITGEKEFREIKRKFVNTRVKVSSIISGITVLNNCCVYNHSVLVSSPAIQLSGIKELCVKPSVTCGRQWPVKFLTEKQINNINNISQLVGKIMDKKGFRGFFGLDFLIEKSTGKIYLSEDNARLTASSPFYTRLERGLDKIPLLVYHLASFMGNTIAQTDQNAGDVTGSQISLRKFINKYFFSEAEGFGVFRFKKEKIVLIGKDYFPEKLESGEFIYMSRNRHNLKKTEDEEIARIEIKQEVLDKPDKLKLWFKKLL